MKSTKKFFLFLIPVVLCVVAFRVNRIESLSPGKPTTTPPSASSATFPSTHSVARKSKLHPALASQPQSNATAPVVAKTNERFPGSKVLDSRDGPLNSEGQFTRLELLQTGMKYPFLRVEQVLEFDPTTHAEKLLNQIEMVADHVVVDREKDTTDAQFEQAINAIGGTVRRKLQIAYSDSYLIALPQATLDAVPGAVDKLAKFDNIFTFAEPDFLSHKTSAPNDPEFLNQWHLENIGQTGGVPDADIDAPEAWSIQTGNSSVVIAISDTGIDYNHPDLAANIWSNPNETNNGWDDDGDGYVDDTRGWNFAYGNKTPFDDEGHGTFVAGVIGAVGNNNIGTVGVCWHCKMMPLKVLDDTGAGYNSDIAEGFDYARLKGAKIINASHGGPSDTLLKMAVDNLQASGVLLAAAADNGARNQDAWKEYPASYTNSNVIGVSASDHKDRIAYFANYGATSVDLFAPGDDIFSTGLDGDYGLDSGTSFATPQVAAVAGLLLAQNPGWTADQIKQAILKSVDLNPYMTGKCVSGGRLNAFRALAGIYNGDSGTIDVPFNPVWTVTGSVTTLVPQNDGKLIAGGAFANATIHNINRFNANGVIDATFRTGAGANGFVNAVVLQPDGKILIAGTFTRFNNVLRNHIARLNANGTLDATFNPGTGANGTVNALLIQPNGKIVLGGAFSSVNGISHPNIARLNLNGSVDADFNPVSPGLVQCLALQSDGKIISGGDAIARINPDGSSDGSFASGSGVNGLIRSIALDGSGLILIGGDFTTYNTVAQGHVARLFSNGNLDGSFNTVGANGPNATVKSIAIEDDCSILLAGNFSTFNGVAQTGFSRLDSNGTLDQKFNASMSQFPGASVIAPLNDGRLYLGGSFTNYGSFPRRYITRIIGRDLNFGTNSFSVSTNLAVGPNGGDSLVAMTTSGCAPWKTFTGTNDWITLTTGATGIGSGNVGFTVAPNTNRFPRSVTLTIAGKTVVVTQGPSFAPPTFGGQTLRLNDQLLITLPATNTFVWRVGTNETFGTYLYSIVNPTSGSLTITDDLGTDTIYLSFTTPTTGSYTDTRGGSGNFNLYPTRPDFDGDGRSDLLWTYANNLMRTWSMDGTNFLGTNSVAGGRIQKLPWKLVAANDFNLDGQTDLLWQNNLGAMSIWLMNKTNFQKAVPFGTSGGYRVIGMTDLNYDGKKDLVFETSTGYMLAWFLKGTTRLGLVRLNHNKPVPLSLKPVGFDDFNHDGQGDLLWQGTNNVLSVWTMSGTNFTGTNALNNGQPISSEWHAVAINDFNDDGNPDVLFENTAGELWVWLLNGTDVIDSFWLNTGELVDPKWRIAAPR